MSGPDGLEERTADLNEYIEREFARIRMDEQLADEARDDLGGDFRDVVQDLMLKGIL